MRQFFKVKELPALFYFETRQGEKQYDRMGQVDLMKRNVSLILDFVKVASQGTDGSGLYKPVHS